MEGMFGLPRNGLADVQVFRANSPSAGGTWAQWRKRPGASMLHILAIGAGGGGGNGVIGAASTAAGGGGGGSGAQSTLFIPAFFIPDILYVSVGQGLVGTGSIPTRIAVFPDTTANNALLVVSAGGAGGNAAGAVAGAAGTGGTVGSVGNNPLTGQGVVLHLVGQAGIIGGTTVAGAALTVPITGLIVTGGTGGAGLGAAASVGTAGGAITGVGIISTNPGGIGGSAATTPPTNGSNGYSLKHFHLGGTGGGSTHGSATTTGLVGAMGGAGGIGSGGGGGGGALTGSTAGSTAGGRGGDGLVIITQW